MQQQKLYSKSALTPWSVVLPKAYGAGDVESLPIILQRSVYFCLLHCVPLTALLLVTPAILDAIGVPAISNSLPQLQWPPNSRFASNIRAPGPYLPPFSVQAWSPCCAQWPRPTSGS